MKKTYILHDQAIFGRMIDYIADYMKGGHELPLMVKIEPKELTRTLEQNARLWELLTRVSKHFEWYGEKLLPEDWKDIFSAWAKGQKIVPGIDGGLVALSSRTSKMKIQPMIDMQTLIEAFCAQRGIDIWEDV